MDQPPTTCFYCGESHDEHHIWTSTLMTTGTWLNICESCLANQYHTMVELKYQGIKKIWHALTQRQWDMISACLLVQHHKTGHHAPFDTAIEIQEHVNKFTDPYAGTTNEHWEQVDK